MVLCTYFQQGRCKFGDRCKYEHPGHITAGSQNRFSALGSSAGSSAAGGGRRLPQQNKPFNYGVTAEDIRSDLGAGKGRPEWVFSSYGPGKNPPRQLFGGPQREQSFEEMRLRHYEAATAGNANQAIQEAQYLYEDISRQIQVILNDADGAVGYIIDGEKEHPNRLDIVEGKTGPAPSAFGQTPTAFGQQPASTSASAFGRPSSFGQPSTASSTSGFGQPSRLASTQSAFSQPSNLGQQQPAFGQPSGIGQSQGSAFSRPATLGTGQPAFGKPAFGQPSAPAASGFGQPSNPSPFSQISGQNQNASSLGQPSVLGGQTTAPNPFGKPATSGFDQPSAPSAFGQPSGQTTAPSGFGPPSTTGGFGKPSQVSSPFVQVQLQQQQAIPSPFAQVQQGGPSIGTFGQPSNAMPAPATTTATTGGQAAIQQQPTGPRVSLGPKPLIKVEPNELNPIPSNLTGQTVRDPMTQNLTAWKGRPVKYNDENWPCYLHPDDNKTWVRIHFPDGPPEQAILRDVQGQPEEYTPEVTEQYQFFLENGCFKNGVIPSVPPQVEWMGFDF